MPNIKMASGDEFFSISLTIQRHAAKMSADGELDASTWPHVLDCLTVLDRHRVESIELNVSRLQFVGADGIRLIKRLRDGRPQIPFTLTGATPTLLRYLEVEHRDHDVLIRTNAPAPTQNPRVSHGRPLNRPEAPSTAAEVGILLALGAVTAIALLVAMLTRVA